MLGIDSLREGFNGEAFYAQVSCPFDGAPSKVQGRARNIHRDRPFEFALRSCSRCKHMWIDPFPTQPLLDHLYRTGSNSVIHDGYQAEGDKPILSPPEQHVLAAESLGEPGRYFELGVGKGLLFETFRALGWRCAGVEPGDWGAGIPDVVRSLAEVPAGGAFDMMVALDVLEHVAEPITVLKRLRLLAGDGSRLYLAFPNRESLRYVVQRDRWRMVRPLGHVHYFSRASAARMLEAAGFALHEARTSDLAEKVALTKPRSIAFGAVERIGWGDQWIMTAVPSGC